MPAPSIRPTSSSRTRTARKLQSMVGDVQLRAADHQLVRPVVIVKGKAPKDMKNKEDFWEVVEVVPGARPDAEARRLRLQPRRVHLTRV